MFANQDGGEFTREAAVLVESDGLWALLIIGTWKRMGQLDIKPLNRISCEAFLGTTRVGIMGIKVFSPYNRLNVITWTVT